MRELIYLASPYNHADKAVMQERFEKVAKATAYYLSQGQVIYSSIVHNHYLACNFNLPRTWEFWKNIDYGMLRNATEFRVLMLDGWKESIGVAAEIEAAQVLGIHIDYINPTVMEMFIGDDH